MQMRPKRGRLVAHTSPSPKGRPLALKEHHRIMAGSDAEGIREAQAISAGRDTP